MIKSKIEIKSELEVNPYEWSDRLDTSVDTKNTIRVDGENIFEIFADLGGKNVRITIETLEE